MGLGLGLIGLSTGQPALALLGLAGGLLHVLNHATFKALLFLGAGSVIHAAGTRDIDRLGGLAKRLPWTAACFLIGAVAICGLPPLNGFVSEFLLYLGFFTGVQASAGAPVALSALAAPSLALIGGLAVACFVKVYGVVFLGEPRSAEAGAGQEASWPMLVPMVLLAGLCILIGGVPLVIRDLLAAAVQSSRPELAAVTPGLADLAPFGWLTVMASGLLVALLVVWWIVQRRLRGLPTGTAPTWGCGYLRPTPRMQYSASSFAAQLVGFFGGILRPHVTEPAVTGIFPAPTRFHSHVPETILEHLYLPVLQWLNSRLSVVRRLQHGQLHLYILYIFLTLLALFLIGGV
jgi:hydrogenase-4 component B